MPPRVERAGGPAAAGVLAGVAALHFAWARGASWPFADRERLAAAVDGVAVEDFPGTGITFAVSGLLATAAGLVALQERGRSARLGSAGVSAVLLGRGVVGLARPRLLPAGGRPPFRRLNALVYSPLCLLGGAVIARTVARPRR
jgi:hypothetical protein